MLVENKLALQRGRNTGLVWAHRRAVNWIHWVKDHSSSEWHCLQIRQEEVRAHIQFPFAVPHQVFLCSFSHGVIEVQELAFYQILDRGRNHYGSRLARCFSGICQDKPQHFYYTKSFMLNAQFLEESRHSNSKVLEKILKLTDNFAVYFKYSLELAVLTWTRLHIHVLLKNMETKNVCLAGVVGEQRSLNCTQLILWCKKEYSSFGVLCFLWLTLDVQWNFLNSIYSYCGSAIPSGWKIVDWVSVHWSK